MGDIRDASDFVQNVSARLASCGGVCGGALDSGLLGDWWYEGVIWLDAVIEEAKRQGLALAALDEALERREPVSAPAELPVTSWGRGGDLRTWSGAPSAAPASQAGTAELHLLDRGERPNDRALRELLALQSSDWAFLQTHGLAGGYPVERVAGHFDGLRRALEAGDRGEQALRNLAPTLTGWEG